MITKHHVAELIKRIRRYQKWFGKDATPGAIADTAPFEAADVLEQLQAALTKANDPTWSDVR